MLCALRNSRPPIRSKCSTPTPTYSCQHWGAPCSAGLHWRREEPRWTFPTGSRCGPSTHTSLSLRRAGPQEGRPGSHLYRTHTGEWIPAPASDMPWGYRPGGSKSGSYLSPCPQRPVPLGTLRGQSQGARADSSQTRRAESSPSFSWGLSNRDSPPFLSHSQRPEPRPQPDLCTSWVFSCFSLLFRSPLVRLSFSSSVTFFSRKLTYNRGRGGGG